jgi:hypothetical protein
LLFITQAEFKCIRLIVSLVPFSPFPVHHWFQEETPDAKLQMRIFTKKSFSTILSNRQQLKRRNNYSRQHKEDKINAKDTKKMNR